jgi:hypothetical protein
MLTVPEQYAGQLMKCPLCNGTFTVPALPPNPSAPAPASAAPGFSPPPAPLPAKPEPEPDIYSFHPEPPPPAPSAPPSPTFTPAAPPKQETGDIQEQPIPPAVIHEPLQEPYTPPSLPPAGYHRTRTLWFSPRVLQWIPSVGVLLIFILQIFSWVGVYAGGLPVFTQNAWQAAFNGGTPDPDLANNAEVKFTDEKDNPGVSVSTLFYLLLFLPTMLLTIAVIVITLVPMTLPPAVEKLLPWKWGIVAALNLVTFLFLALQLVLGFSLESWWSTHAEELVAKRFNKDPKKPDKESKTTVEKKQSEAMLGTYLSMLSRTFWLRLSVWLHLLVIASAAMMYCLGIRGNRPLPKLELVY